MSTSEVAESPSGVIPMLKTTTAPPVDLNSAATGPAGWLTGTARIPPAGTVYDTGVASGTAVAVVVWVAAEVAVAVPVLVAVAVEVWVAVAVLVAVFVADGVMVIVTGVDGVWV